MGLEVFHIKPVQITHDKLICRTLNFEFIGLHWIHICKNGSIFKFGNARSDLIISAWTTK